jgi:cell division protein FtsA
LQLTLKDEFKMNKQINKHKTPVIAGLDIGSSKVSLIIATVSDDQRLEVVGVGTAPNIGIRQGVVVNIEATTEAIRKARDEAELMAGYKIEEVFAGISGSHIRSFDSKGMVAIKNKEVTQQDVDRVIEAGKAVAVPTDRMVLHVIPREYKVDGQDGIHDPIGMSGIRLEANVHIVTGSHTAISNNLKCIERAGLKVVGLVLDPIAAGMSVLSEDEKSLGVCVVDMGAGSCKLVYYVNGSVAHTSTIPVGGQHFSHDIAVGLRTPQISAEELKKRYGCAMASLVSQDETVEVEGVGGRKSRTVLRRDLAEVIEPRAEETLQLIHHDLQTSGLMPLLGSGVVLTGGASQLDGLVELGEFVLDIPVRRGNPIHERSPIGGLTEVIRSNAFSTAVGLLLWGRAQKKFTRASRVPDEIVGDSINTIGNKMKNFFEGLF